MDRHSICGAVDRHPGQQHALHDVRRDLLPGLHTVMDQRQRDIGQQLHLERSIIRTVHAAAAPDGLDQLVIANCRAQELGLRIGMRNGPNNRLPAIAQVN